MNQWFLKMTHYADDLLEKINDLDVLIEFFEQRERYEDCGYLLQIKDKIIANAEFKLK